MEEILAALPPWLVFELGTDDLPDAFRGCPVRSGDRRGAVVAIWSPVARAWRFLGIVL